MFHDSSAEEQIDQAIKKAIGKSTVWLGQLAAGAIPFSTLKARVFGEMRRLYTATAELGVGGPLDADERVFLEASLQEQLFAEVGSEDFGLSGRMSEYQDDVITMGQFSQTVSNYLKSSRGQSIEMWSKREGETIVRRQLGDTKDHCYQCKMYAALPAMKLKDAVIPGRDCDCYTNCLCTLMEV